MFVFCLNFNLSQSAITVLNLNIQLVASVRESCFGTRHNNNNKYNGVCVYSVPQGIINRKEN